ncbi:CBS domain-containing protein [Streptomyces sp. NPDC055092]
MATAREIMTADAECVGEHGSVLDAARKMTGLGVGALPVCGSNESLIGMVAQADIARALPDPQVGQFLEALSTD